MISDRISSRKGDLASLCALLVIITISFYTLCLLFPMRWAALYMSYGRALIIVMATLYFCHMRLNGCVENKILLFYAVWMLITRLLNGDTYLQNEYDLVLSRLLCFIVAAVPFTLEHERRQRFYDVVIAIYCGVFFVAALLGLYCCFTGCYIVLPFESCTFGIINSDVYLYTNYVSMFGTIRNISCVWTFTAWCLMSYEFARTKSRAWRVPIALAWLVFSLSLIMSYTRTIVIIFCASLAMLVMILMLKRLRFKNNFVKAVCLALAAVLILVVCYKGVNITRNALCSVSSRLTVSMPRVSNDIVTYHNSVSTDFSDPRLSDGSGSTLSGRTNIYSVALKILRDEPSTLLKGKYSFKIQPAFARYIPITHGLYIQHAHNYLLQTALLTGLVGLAAVVLYTLITVLHLLRLFFSSDARISVADKLLTVLPAGLFIYSMLEIMIFTNCCDDRYIGCDLRELMFFLAVGMFTARYHDLFPKIGKNKG